MVIESLAVQTLIAVVGGCSAELFHWYSLARSGKPVAKYARTFLYWITTLGMVAVGGLMPFIYSSGGEASAALCFHLGAATPLLLAKLLGTIPAVVNGATHAFAGNLLMRDFLNW